MGKRKNKKEKRSDELPLEETATDTAEVEEEAEAVDPLMAATLEADDLKDRLQRTMAEFQNFRRQSAKRRDDDRRLVAKDIFTQVLPVLDNLQMALDAARSNPDDANIVQGVEMIQQLLLKVLQDNQVEPIATEGLMFDPALHDAVTAEERDDVEPNSILATMLPGYSMGEFVLRHARVTVSSRPSAESDLDEDTASIDPTSGQGIED